MKRVHLREGFCVEVEGDPPIISVVKYNDANCTYAPIFREKMNKETWMKLLEATDRAEEAELKYQEKLKEEQKKKEEEDAAVEKPEISLLAGEDSDDGESAGTPDYGEQPA